MFRFPRRDEQHFVSDLTLIRVLWCCDLNLLYRAGFFFGVAVRRRSLMRTDVLPVNYNKTKTREFSPAGGVHL